MEVICRFLFFRNRIEKADNMRHQFFGFMRRKIFRMFFHAFQKFSFQP